MTALTLGQDKSVCPDNKASSLIAPFVVFDWHANWPLNVLVGAYRFQKRAAFPHGPDPVSRAPTDPTDNVMSHMCRGQWLMPYIR